MKKAFCFDICSCHYLRQNLSSSDLRISQVTSVQKRESRKHFSASAYGLGFKKLFLSSLSSTSVTLEKLKSDEDKFFLRRVMDKYRNKILLLAALFSTSITWEKPNYTWNIFPESSQNNYSNKILFFPTLAASLKISCPRFSKRQDCAISFYNSTYYL